MEETRFAVALFADAAHLGRKIAFILLAVCSSSTHNVVMLERNPIVHYGKPAIGITIVIATLVGLSLAIFGEEFRVAAKIWLVVLVPHWFIIIYLVWLAHDFKSRSFALPSVKSVKFEERMILVDGKEWLGMAVAILLFKLEGKFERLLCQGTVINVQENGLVQIRLIVEGLGEEELLQLKSRLGDGELSSLIVKPGQFIESLK